MDNNLTNTQLDDQKMENLRKRTKLSKYIMIAGGVCFGIMAIIFLASGKTTLGTDSPEGLAAILLALAGFVLLVAGLVVKQKAGEAQKHIANNYARSVLGRVMDRLDTFDHGKHIDRYYLNQDFGFPKYDCTGFCGDYVRGVLRGVPMEFCEFELQEEHVTEDNDGDTDVSYETVFYGVIVVCRHNLALSDAVMATQFKTYAAPFHSRPAYGWGAELSVYLRMDARRKGTGSALYRALEEVLRAQGVLNLNACIACPVREDEFLTFGSIRFHERQGYRMVGKFTRCGYKFGRWYDMVWMEKLIGAHTPTPAPVRAFPEVWEQFRLEGRGFLW